MTLIDAVGQLFERGHDFELVLLGDGPLRRAGRVSLPGWVDSERFAEAARHAGSVS